jgi:hypothetical protein
MIDDSVIQVHGRSTTQYHIASVARNLPRHPNLTSAVVPRVSKTKISFQPVKLSITVDPPAPARQASLSLSES